MGISENHDVLQNIRVYCAFLFPFPTSTIEARAQYRCLPGPESESRSDAQIGDNLDLARISRAVPRRRRPRCPVALKNLVR